MLSSRPALIWFAALCALTAMTISGACGSISAPDSPSCDPTLWDHVYQPSRLHVVSDCRSMTGVVFSEHHNEDGDVDIEVTPDAEFAAMLNDTNIAKLKGTLQVEAVCQATVQRNRTDAAPACNGYQGTVVVPPVGSHVRVVGAYVLDTNHGWMEIHPVTSITMISP